MKKAYWIALAVLALAATGVMAEVSTTPADKAAPKQEKELVAQDMTAIGTITKHENKKKDGTPMMTWFTLVDEEGKDVRLPKGKVEEFVGSKVKITGTGTTIEKKGKTVRAFKTITAIEKVDVPATPAK
jgi:hypothetical protein